MAGHLLHTLERNSICFVKTKIWHQLAVEKDALKLHLGHERTLYFHEYLENMKTIQNADEARVMGRILFVMGKSA